MPTEDGADTGGAPSHSLSIDIGGTFTDFALWDADGGEMRVHKVLTDAEDPTRALIRGTREILRDAGAEPSALKLVVHSATLATNAIIERKGAKTALLTTRGFRDILEMGRESIYDMHDLHARFPEPLVPRSLRAEATERMDRDGEALIPLDIEDCARAVDALADMGAESIAVCLLHSYANPTHEAALKALIAERHPDMPVSLSSEVAPVINEYERVSTTTADGYVKPLISRYIREVERELAAEGCAGPLLVTHSAGGVMDAAAAMERPIRLLESGPAAGALAAAFYSDLLGEPDLISLDMGGTTAKTCVIEGGEPSRASMIEVARVHRFKIGSGLPILIPVLDLIEIGAGGGSVAWLDGLGRLRVGPQSAGASPGPACYGLGGESPTVTDANLVLGYLNPDYFLGGRMSLDADAARRALAALGARMGMDAPDAARGVYDVVAENMAAAARIHIIGRNKDPRDYAIVAFGGAGPAHACAVARILGARRVIVPLGAGVTSALGSLAAPLSFESVRSAPNLLERTDWRWVETAFAEMETRARDALANAGISEDAATVERSADMRLSGQIHEIEVPAPGGPLSQASVERLTADFHDIYQSLYSRRNLSLPIEVRNWRVRVSGPKPDLRLPEREISETADAASRALKTTRPARFPETAGFVSCPVYDRYRLPPGAEIAGPAIVEEEEAATVINPGDKATVDRWLNLVIRLGG